jgi:DNA-binding GntR family transcriptional regulator
MADGNGDANEAIIQLCFERLSALLDELARTDPEEARALMQTMIERIRAVVEE